MGGHVAGYKTLSDMIDRVHIEKIPTVAVRAATKDTLSYLMFSSGTSGLPKGAYVVSAG